MATSRIVELTDIIAKNTKIVDDFLNAEGKPALSFAVDGPSDFPVPSSNTDIQHARRVVVNATQELHDLMVGPRESVRWMAWSVSVLPKTSRACVTCHTHTWRPTCMGNPRDMERDFLFQSPRGECDISKKSVC